MDERREREVLELLRCGVTIPRAEFVEHARRYFNVRPESDIHDRAIDRLIERGLVLVMDRTKRTQISIDLGTKGVGEPLDGIPDEGALDLTEEGVRAVNATEGDDLWWQGSPGGTDIVYTATLRALGKYLDQESESSAVYDMSKIDIHLMRAGPWCTRWWARIHHGYSGTLEIPWLE